MCPQELCILSDLVFVHPWNDSCDYCNSFCSLPLQQCLVIALYLLGANSHRAYIVFFFPFLLMLNCWREKRANKTSSWSCIFGGKLIRDASSFCCTLYIYSVWLMEKTIYLADDQKPTQFVLSINSTRWVIHVGCFIFWCVRWSL